MCRALEAFQQGWVGEDRLQHVGIREVPFDHDRRGANDRVRVWAHRANAENSIVAGRAHDKLHKSDRRLNGMGPVISRIGLRADTHVTVMFANV